MNYSVLYFINEEKSTDTVINEPRLSTTAELCTSTHYHWRLDVITFQDPFFQDICKPTSCLHRLIPPPRDTSVTTRLRLTTSLPRPNLCTKKYCSLINFGLHHYQYQPTQWLLTHSTHLSQPPYVHMCTLFVSFAVLSIISTAYHLLSGSRAASLLLNWLILNWLIDCLSHPVLCLNNETYLKSSG